MPTPITVHTIYGTVTGLIDANLRDSNHTRLHEFERPKFTYDIRLPDYSYGQAVSIDLGPDADNTYYWYLDGELHTSGLGKSSFSVWPDKGVHEISVIARNPDGAVVSTGAANTEVSEEAALEISVQKRDRISFTAPGGYSRVTWAYDGKVISENHPDRSEADSQIIRFSKKGRHTLTCRAEDSESGDFRLISWVINVN